MHEACFHGFQDIAQLLIDHGADVNQKDTSIGMTDVYMILILQELFGLHFTEPQWYVIDLSSVVTGTQQGRCNIVQLLLDNDADIHEFDENGRYRMKSKTDL